MQRHLPTIGGSPRWVARRIGMEALGAPDRYRARARSTCRGLRAVKPAGDVACQIELPVSGAGRARKSGAFAGSSCSKACAERLVDLVARPGRCTARSRRRCVRAARPALPSRQWSASVTPSTAPLQPAWAAPITPASRSASRTGAQSAVTIPSTRPGPVGHQGIGLRARRHRSTARPR